MKAIRTRYLGPTDKKDSRIKADDGHVNSVILPFDSDVSYEENFRRAAQALCRKIGWPLDTLIGGSYKGDYYWTRKDQ